MTEYISLEQIKKTSDLIQAQSAHRPKIGMILGSGLGLLADEVENADYVEYSQIPYWPESTVEGHSGQLVIGNLEGQSVVVMQGRAHYYEGYSFNQTSILIDLFKTFNPELCIITNSSGCLNLKWDLGNFYIYCSISIFRSVKWVLIPTN